MSQSADRKAVKSQHSCRIARREGVQAVVVLAAVLCLSSCASLLGSNQSTQNSQPTPAIAVSISPPSAHISPKTSVQFTARVAGTSNVGVVWSAVGGTISSNGLFTASSGTTAATITATSVADPTSSASAAVSFASSGMLSILTTSLPAAQTGAPYSATLTSSGGTPPYSWSVASGTLPQGFSFSNSGSLTGTAIQVGSYSFTVKVADASSQTVTLSENLQVNAGSNLNYTGFDGPAELPRVYLKTTLADTPAPGSTITVNAGGDFQAALNSANCGDTISLQSGATFTGNFSIPAKSCDDQHWIIIRSSAADPALPQEGTRINPCYAGVASLPGRPAFSCPAVKNVMAKILFNGTGGNGPIQFLAGANHYRLIGLEVTRSSPQAHLWNLIAPMQDTYATDHLVFDRLWVHGTASDETKGGIHLTGATYAAVVDSYFSDLHCIAIHGSCTDSQAINGGGGSLVSGPYKIDNNFLEAGAQSIMFGGSPGTITPTDIEIRYNHLFKPLMWQPGATGFVGGYTGDAYVVKNHLELKNAQRVLFEGNLLEDNWGGFSQAGFSIVLTPKTQNGGCMPCQVTDVTIRYNKISNVGGGFDIANVEDATGGYAVAGERYSIHDLVIDNVSKSKYNGDGELLMMLNTSTTEVLKNVTMQHITGFPDLASHITSMQDPVPPMSGFVFVNNLVQSPIWPTWSAGGGYSDCASSETPLTILQTCFGTGGYVFTGNVLVGDFSKYPASKWPAGQTFLPSMDSVGFVDYAHGNYQLSSSSPYKGKSTDGRDPGADVAGLTTMIAGVQ
ncbi:MAG TPA: Ig domain-containing protein [Candidatus Sulfotelmatobacter sp.]|nr:Ig domain-containing protein [Candidatus Sulfotelmatobacter sp.]